MAESVFVVLLFVVAFALAMRAAPLWLWAACAAIATFLWQTGLVAGEWGARPTALSLLAWLPALALALLSVPFVRRMAVTEPTFNAVRGSMPKISDTERRALEAGTVGFDAEIFSGRPDWAKLRAVPPVLLTAEEQAFLDGPTDELCRMIDDWQVRRGKDIPEDIWSFVKTNGFLGMLISREHGGLGFSAQAQSLVLGKISSRPPDVT